jgi:hypothetical protein
MNVLPKRKEAQKPKAMAPKVVKTAKIKTVTKLNLEATKSMSLAKKKALLECLTHQDPKVMKGKLLSWIKTLQLNTTYLGTEDSMNVPFLLHSKKGKTEEKALLDSGATENCMDITTAKRLGLGMQKLSKP